MALLDIDSVPPNNKKSTQVWIELNGTNHLIANLSRQIPQLAMDIGFSKQSIVAFFLKGPGNVYINGLYAGSTDDDQRSTTNDNEEQEK